MSELGLSVPEAANGPVAAPAQSNPGNELDALLKEFHAGVSAARVPSAEALDRAREAPRTAPAPQPSPSPSPMLSPELGTLGQQISSLKGQLDTMQGERQAEAEAKDIAESVAALRTEADLPDGYSEQILVGYLNQLVLDDPRAAAAWQERAQNPRGWKRTLETAAETLRTSNERIGSFRDDAMRAALSMRNISTEPIRSQPRNPALDFRLSDQEWEARKQQYAAEGR